MYIEPWVAVRGGEVIRTFPDKFRAEEYSAKRYSESIVVGPAGDGVFVVSIARDGEVYNLVRFGLKDSAETEADMRALGWEAVVRRIV